MDGLGRRSSEPDSDHSRNRTPDHRPCRCRRSSAADRRSSVWLGHTELVGRQPDCPSGISRPIMPGYCICTLGICPAWLGIGCPPIGCPPIALGNRPFAAPCPACSPRRWAHALRATQYAAGPHRHSHTLGPMRQPISRPARHRPDAHCVNFMADLSDCGTLRLDRAGWFAADSLELADRGRSIISDGYGDSSIPGAFQAPYHRFHRNKRRINSIGIG